MKEDGPWKTKKTKAVYETAWIKVNHNEVINPGGKDGVYGVVEFKNLAIGIIALDEELNTWIVRQYRYPIDKYTQIK